eukprot:9425002-Pyramimonas_sp.AAC.1
MKPSSCTSSPVGLKYMPSKRRGMGAAPASSNACFILIKTRHSSSPRKMGSELHSGRALATS